MGVVASAPDATLRAALRAGAARDVARSHALDWAPESTPPILPRSRFDLPNFWSFEL